VQNIGQFLPILVAGFLISAVVGYFVIHWLLQYINQHSLYPFAIYCVSIGVIVLGFNFLSPQYSSAVSSVNGVNETIYFDVSLDWIIPDANACNTSGAGLILNIVNSSNLPDDASGAYQFAYSSQPPENVFTYLLGYETLSIVVNPENPLTQITRQQLQKIFNSEYTTWADFMVDCPLCGSLSESAAIGHQEIQSWIYPSDSSLQQVINNYLSGHPTFMASFLAPSPQAMREVLQINPAAIGFLPSHWLDASVKAIELTGSSLQGLQLPILAISPTEPDQTFKSFILCIQSSLEGG